MASRITTIRSPGGRLLTIEAIDNIPSTANMLEKIAKRGGNDGYIVLSETSAHSDTTKKRDNEKGLLVSILLRPSLPPSRVAMLSVLGALALVRTVHRHSPLEPGIRWVGDIYADKQKIAETTTRGMLLPGGAGFRYVIVSFSLRLEGNFTKTLPEVVRSVFSPRRESPAERISETLITEFFSLYEGMAAGEAATFLDEYRDLSLLRGKRIRVARGGRYVRATVLGIDDDAGLVVALRRGGSTVLHSVSELYDPRRAHKSALSE